MESRCCWTKFKSGLRINATSFYVAFSCVESFVNTSEMLENHQHNKSKSDKGYHAVPPPFTGNFIPRKLIKFIDDIVKLKIMDVTTVFTSSNGNPQQKEYKEKGVIDSGCSRHSDLKTKCYLNLSEDHNGLICFLLEMGIKREFSVTRTPQQNGVAERRNITLIEDARTMLVDSKLPSTFWAEAVNTACYMLNRVLVIKPHNKTPYELIHRRTPLIDFMKPFGLGII
ncbi:ribonuclease H-like domain-containing protein [Tanacetum coccineum]